MASTAAGSGDKRASSAADLAATRGGAYRARSSPPSDRVARARVNPPAESVAVCALQGSSNDIRYWCEWGSERQRRVIPFSIPADRALSTYDPRQSSIDECNVTQWGFLTPVRSTASAG